MMLIKTLILPHLDYCNIVMSDMTFEQLGQTPAQLAAFGTLSLMILNVLRTVDASGPAVVGPVGVTGVAACCGHVLQHARLGFQHPGVSFTGVSYTGLLESPTGKIQRCKIVRPCRPVDRAIPPNPLSWILLVQEIMHHSEKVCRSAIVLELQSMSHLKGHIFQQFQQYLAKKYTIVMTIEVVWPKYTFCNISSQTFTENLSWK
ncbi:hypothetical protein J6590_024865 [Homalodisca vitripennis]|nr:hypothetical protein J6590_024865 [Homalodisca vitripennis]